MKNTQRNCHFMDKIDKVKVLIHKDFLLRIFN